jgi:all-trans-retinol dehydrogenase (NAD+)
MTKLQGKKAVVTGGAMGIGLATCKRLIREGCDVTIWDLNQEEMDKARKVLEGMGGKVFAYHCDVADKERVNELAVRAEKDMGRVDILINSAAFVRAGKFLEIPVEDSVKQIDINVNSMLYTIHALLPGMMERNSGHIVNIASGVAIAGTPGLAAYTTSKWAVWGLTDVLRLEVMAEGKKGVKFTSVHPGNITTGMFEGFKLNWLGRIIYPPVKDHDVIAKGIVESGLKWNIHIVCRPRGLYNGILMRGWVPDFLFARLVLLFGVGDCVKNYKGRKGFIHSDPDAE